MAKVFVVYDSKYDYTKFTSENILKGINEVEGIETAIGYARIHAQKKYPLQKHSNILISLYCLRICGFNAFGVFGCLSNDCCQCIS